MIIHIKLIALTLISKVTMAPCSHLKEQYLFGQIGKVCIVNGKEYVICTNNFGPSHHSCEVAKKERELTNRINEELGIRENLGLKRLGFSFKKTIHLISAIYNLVYS